MATFSFRNTTSSWLRKRRCRYSRIGIGRIPYSSQLLGLKKSETIQRWRTPLRVKNSGGRSRWAKQVKGTVFISFLWRQDRFEFKKLKSSYFITVIDGNSFQLYPLTKFLQGDSLSVQCALMTRTIFSFSVMSFPTNGKETKKSKTSRLVIERYSTFALVEMHLTWLANSSYIFPRLFRMNL